MNIRLMCQGQQRRLRDLEGPKHLLDVGGEPIVVRTLRLIREVLPHGFHMQENALVTVHAPDGPYRDDLEMFLSPHPFRQAVHGRADAILPLANPGICIVDGILAAADANAGWGTGYHGRQIILLGDVVWSRAALRAFLADERPVVFAGTPVLSPSEGEVFALGFDDPQAMRNLCMSCPCRVDGSRLRGFRQQQGGHLRRLLWHAQERAGLKVHPSLRRSWHESMYLPIEDWTTDIDTPKDAARLPELARLAALEERQALGDCDVKPFSSRACERGTHGCETHHVPAAVADTLA